MKKSKTKNTDFLSLKWWKIKMCKWENQSDEVAKLFDKYYEEDEKINKTPSLMLHKINQELRNILLEIIEKFDWEIDLNFSGETLNKQQAKDYILHYED